MPRKPTVSFDHHDRAAMMVMLRRLEPKDRFERFRQLEAQTAKSLFEMACCAESLKNHPAYFSRIKNSKTLLRIYRGEIDLDAYLAFIDSAACEPVTRMPKEEQRKAARKPKVKVVDLATRETREANLDTLDRKTASQVCGPRGIRTEAEQNEYLDSLPPPRPRAKTEEPKGHGHTVYFKTAENLAILEEAKRQHTSVPVLLWRLANDAGYLQPRPPRPQPGRRPMSPRPPQ